MLLQSLYFLIRRIAGYRLLYLIIITNLIIGFATFVIISQFISGELQWDKHNLNYDRIYRVQLFMDQKENSIKHTWSVTAALSRKDLADLPEIEKLALIHDVGDNNKSGIFLSTDRKNQFLTRYGYYADQTVFEIFSFRFTDGNQAGAFIEPFSVVLSKSLSNKLFPEGNALGKQLYFENKLIFTVTGVYEDLPLRSTWRPLYLIPMQLYSTITGQKDYESNYRGYSFYTYVLLKPKASPILVDNKIYSALKDYREEHHPYLRPMSKLNLNPFFDPALIIALSLIGSLSVLILLLTSINFINLQTVNAANRFREIGIRKTIGFTKKRIWMHFMIESITLTVFSALIGIMLAELALPYLNSILSDDNSVFAGEVFPGIMENKNLIFILLGVTIVTGFLSGIHPAYVITSYNPVSALKQKFTIETSNGVSLKKVLVTIQFSISVFMLIVAFIIYRQSEYMLSKDVGFNDQTILFSNIITDKQGEFEPLKSALLAHNEISNVCISDYIPFILPGGNDLHWEGANPDEKVFVRFSFINYDFVPTYGLKMLSGRNFSREYLSDGNNCLINETAVKVFGWSDPLGRNIEISRRNYMVIGVIKDYTVFSVFNPNEPHLYRLIPDTLIPNAVYSVSYLPGKDREALKIVKKEFGYFFPDDAFDFSNIQMLVKNENAVKAFKSLRKLTGLIAILTLVISSIGLFGLILFMTQRRMKEIGIRKVLGFSSGNLYMTLSSWFIKLVVISLLFAWPAAFYVYKILPGADKYELQIWEFLLATLVLLLVLVITISYQIVKALKVNPVHILKDE